MRIDLAMDDAAVLAEVLLSECDRIAARDGEYPTNFASPERKELYSLLEIEIVKWWIGLTGDTA